MIETKIRTYKNIFIDFVHPTPDMIDIEDIAHSLSMRVRWGGMSDRFYAIAEHCLLMSNVIAIHGTRQEALQALLHDASEAYLGDVIRPIKMQPSFKEWRDIDEHLQAVIWQTFGVPKEMLPAVREADERMILTEQRDLLGGKKIVDGTFSTSLKPYSWCINPMQFWQSVERAFLDRFAELVM